ncbi:MAG: ATP-binding protein [Methylophilus sp.]|nr:ATP-binding protein [Methylophilus sp.]
MNLNQILLKNSHRVMALMLLSLHAFLIFFDKDVAFRQMFYFLSFGIFLVWQPVWRGNQKLSLFALVGLVAIGLFGFFYFNWWLTALWLAILFGLLGGRIFSGDSKKNRLIHILAASYLLAMLLLWVVPKLLNATEDLQAAEFVIFYMMPFLPLSILFIHNTLSLADDSPVVDFFYTLMLFMLAIIIILGSYAIGTLQQVNYIQVMFYTISGMAVILFGLSYLWRPSTRFSGVELLMSRYLLSIGMPFEHWVKNIATLAEHETTPNGFTQAAMNEMMKLGWVSGISWMADETRGQLGQKTSYSTEFNFKDFYMTLHSRWQMSPALYVHVKLLTQIMGEFYEAKRREETLRQNTYMQAFYETGSRLTHDIKNILQSVGTLVTAAQQTSEEDNENLLKLIKKQLPVLNQRIAATLDKLKAPSEEKKRQEKISAWWKNLRLRYTQPQVEFVANNLPTHDINADVLDSILDNLLSNALEKTKYEPNTLVKVEIIEEQKHYKIQVTDTGKSMGQNTAQQLFKKHISSQNGLGVGLYHAAQDAFQAGYSLALTQNTDGAVQFTVDLSPPTSANEAASESS